jgi:hypothetical protein
MTVRVTIPLSKCRALLALRAGLILGALLASRTDRSLLAALTDRADRT